MPYEKVHETWEDHPSTATPVDAAALEHIEQGIFDAHGIAAGALQPDDVGTAAAADADDFATAAQGALADTAVQPGDLGTAAAADADDFATAAQGDKADTAVQSPNGSVSGVAYYPNRADFPATGVPGVIYYNKVE